MLTEDDTCTCKKFLEIENHFYSFNFLCGSEIVDYFFS